MITQNDAWLMIKGATRRCVKLAGYGNIVAMDLGVSESLLSRWQHPDYEEVIRSDLIPVLEKLAGCRLITDTLARMHGCVLVKESGDTPGKPDLSDLLGLIGKSSELTSTLSAALEDDIVTAHETRNVLAGIDQLRRELHAIESKLRG